MTEPLAPPAFFVSGGTVPLGAASYVLREADRALLAALREGRYAYVLTSRQMGKSSLSVRTMETLRREGVRTAFLDLTRIGGRNVTAEQWYAGLLGEVGRGLGDRAAMMAYWKAHAELGPMQRFFGALREVALAPSDLSPRPSLQDEPLGEGESVPSPQPSPPEGRGGRVVVFIDEIDATRSLPFSTDEFFAGIRECFNRRVEDPAMARLAFCLIGVAIPSDLMSDAKLTPFNVGERIVLRDFSPKEAAALAPGFGPSGGALVERIVHWTGGHPFLTQSLGRRLAEEGAKTTGDVDRIVAEEFFGARARDTNINLADVGNRVLNSYDDPNAVPRYRSDILALYEGVLKGRRVPDDESNRLVAVLKLSGLVAAVDGRLRVRNRIYARVYGAAWIEEHMPSQELRRQQRAFRLGMIRAGAGAAAMLAVVGSLAVVAADNARRANLALDQVRRERDRSDALTKQAQTERDRANLNAAEAKRATLAADAARGKAQGLALDREKALKDVQAQKARADAQANLAFAQTGIANEQRRAAEGRRLQAVASAAAARRAEVAASDEKRVAVREGARAERSLAEARRQNYRSYVSGIAGASALIDQGQLDPARTLLRAARDTPRRGWEYDHLMSVVAQAPSRPLDRRPKAIRQVAYSPDGTRLFTGGDDGWIVVTDPRTARAIGAFRASPSGIAVIALAVMPDASLAVIDATGALARLDARGRWLWARPNPGFAIAAIAASADGEEVAVCGQAGNVAVLGGKDGRVLRRFRLGDHENYLSSIAFAPQGHRLAVSSLVVDKDNAWICDDDGTHVMGRACGGIQYGVAWSPDGRLVAVVGGQGVYVLNAATGEVAYSLNTSAAQAVASSKDGSRWAVATLGGSYSLWDAHTGRLASVESFPDAGSLTSVVASPNGEEWAFADIRGHAYLSPVDRSRSRPAVFASRQNYVLSAASSRDGSRIAYAYPVNNSGTPRFRIVVTDAAGERPTSFEVTDLPASLDLSPDGRRIATAGKYVADVYDVATGKTLLHATGSEDGIRYSPDGRTLLVAEVNGATLYDVASLRPIRRVAATVEARSVAFSPDGQTLSVGLHGGLLLVQDIAGRTKPRLVADHSAGIYALDFSPDGRRLATGAGSTFHVLDVASGNRLLSIDVPGGSAEGVRFSPDGHRLYTQSLGALQGATRVWDASTGQHLLALGSEHTGGGRALTLVGGDPVVGYADGTFVRYAAFGEDELRRLALEERNEAARHAISVREVDVEARRLQERAQIGVLIAHAQWPDARIALNAAIQEEPGALDLRRARVESLGRLGLWAGAERDLRFLVAHADGKLDERERYELAVAVAAQGHRTDFARLRRDLLAESNAGRAQQKMRYMLLAGTFPVPLSNVERASLTHAVADPSPMPESDGANYAIWNAYSALALVRLGREEEAIERAARVQRIEKANEIAKTAAVLTIVLAEIQEDKLAQARRDWEALGPRLRKLDEEFAARKFGDFTWPIVLELRTIRTEIEALLRKGSHPMPLIRKLSPKAPLLGCRWVRSYRPSVWCTSSAEG